MAGAYSLSSFPKKHSAPMPLSGLGALLWFLCVIRKLVKKLSFFIARSASSFV